MLEVNTSFFLPIPSPIGEGGGIGFLLILFKDREDRGKLRT